MTMGSPRVGLGGSGGARTVSEAGATRGPQNSSLRRGLQSCAIKSGLDRLPSLCFGKIAVDVGDFGVGKVGPDRVHFAMVILDSLFDDLRTIAQMAGRLGPFTDRIVGHLQSQRDEF